MRIEEEKKSTKLVYRSVNELFDFILKFPPCKQDFFGELTSSKNDSRPRQTRAYCNTNFLQCQLQRTLWKSTFCSHGTKTLMPRGIRRLRHGNNTQHMVTAIIRDLGSAKPCASEQLWSIEPMQLCNSVKLVVRVVREKTVSISNQTGSLDKAAMVNCLSIMKA